MSLSAAGISRAPCHDRCPRRVRVHDVVLPARATSGRRIAVALSGLGQQGKADDRLPAWRRAQRAYLGPVLPGAARRFSLHRARPARPRRHRLGARRRLFDCRAGRRHQGFIDHIGLDKFVLVGMSMGAINSLAFAINHHDRLSHLVIIDAGPEMRRPGSSRIRDFVNDVAEPSSIEAIIEQALAIQPAPRPENPAAQPDARSAAAARRQLALEIRPQPLSAARPGSTPRPSGRALADGLAGDHLPDPGRARRRERRVP